MTIFAQKFTTMTKTEQRDLMCKMIDRCTENIANIEEKPIRLINTMHHLLYQYNIATSINDEIQLEQISKLIDVTKDNIELQMFIKRYLATFLN